ncbi:MAG: S41 family peptidase, partial [Bacteroidota bacterium]|nr:S41 family peptidase [Bacteroidota bacterium]
MDKKKAKKTWMWLVPLAGLMAAAVPLRENYFELSKQLEIMTAMFRELNIYYVDEIQPGQLMETGMDAMVESLDPYTVYYPESRVEDLRFMTTGEYGGIGASMQFINDRHLIVDVLPDFPAARAGLKIGDELLAIDGQSLEGMDPDLVPEMLQGASGTTVDIEYRPNGSTAPVDLTIEREKIKLPAGPYRSVIGDSTGYVILSAFTRGSSFELRQAIRYLKDSVGVNQLVLDLRGNGGGLLQESISIVNLFVEKGQEVVSTRGKKEEWMKSYSTMAPPLVPDLPVAVLIDEQSASASEIVSGTLQD